MVKRWNIINDIKLIIVLFIISSLYSILIYGSLSIDITANIIYLLTCCIYLSNFIVLIQINSTYIKNLYKYLSVCFASIGILAMSCLVYFHNVALGEINLTKASEMVYILSMYEVLLLIFSFLNIKRNINLKKIAVIFVPITFLIGFITINENIKIHIGATRLTNILCRAILIILYGFLYKLLNRNKNNLTEDSFKSFKLYVLFRVIMEVFIILSFNCNYIFRVIVGYLLRFVGNYCIFKIMITEVIKSPHKTIYNKLINKSTDLEIYIQELEKRNREEDIKNQLLSNISHEFKTPVNVIYSAIQMQNLKRDSNDIDEILKFNDIIKQNCHRLTRLINNFIDSSKLRGGEYEVNLKCINIVEVVENTTMSILSFAEIMNIKVVFDTDEEEVYVLGDRDLIERVILNLLSNAIKYNRPYGNIFVNIKSKEDIVEIKIEDSGIGIPKEKKEVIFNRFERVDESLSRHKEGSGLGLSIVKEIILKHEGTICIDSKYGVGTVAVIKLKRIECDEKNCNLDSFNNEIGNGIQEKVEIEMSDIYF